MMTRRGIEYDLKKSPYTTELNGITFYFSSQWHLLKFTQDYMENRAKIADTLTAKANVDVTADSYADMILYNKIETRGYLIKVEGELIWTPDVKLNGEIKTKLS